MIDNLIFASQLKSLYLLGRGKKDESYLVQLNYLRNGIIVSQLYSIINLVKGNRVVAMEIQRNFLRKYNILVQSALALGIGVGPPLLLLIIHALGFESHGIRRGSTAASWMASFHGKIPKGGLFNHLQQIGIQGILPFWWTFLAAIFSGLAIASVIDVAIHVYLSRRETSGYNVIHSEAVTIDRPHSPASID